MNRNIQGIFTVVAGLLIGLYIVLQILTSGGNALGSLYRYLLPAAFIFGFMAPRASVFVLVLCAIYIDMGKKFLVAGENLYFIDLFFVLGIPPVMLLGACTSRALAMFFDSSVTSRRLFPYFVATILVIFGIGAVVIVLSGLNLGVLKLLANSAAYFGLIFLWPSVFQDATEQIKVVRLTLFAMIPAASYGLYHFFFGLNDFEWVYMASGFSRTASYAYDGEGVFGTFASQGALSAIMIMSCCLCLSAFMLKQKGGKPYFNRGIAILFFLLFLTTAILSLKRGPLLILPLFLAVNFFLRTPVRVIIAYVAMISVVLSLVFFGDPIADKLPDLQVKLNKALSVEGEAATKMTKIRTLNVRFREFASLGQAENWSAFGVLSREESKTVIHSKIVSSIFKLGFVPVGVLLLGSSIIAFFLHRWLFRCVRQGRREILFFLSLSAAMVLPSLFGFGSPTTYPIPFFVGLFVAITAKLGGKVGSEPKTRDSTAESEDEVIPLVYASSN